MSLPRVTILMATFNGARHLPEQLASFAAQTGNFELRVIASDDGSEDGTLELLETWGADHPLELRRGPGEGFARNFLALLAASPEGDWIALADQDDVWLPGKLARAYAALQPQKPSGVGGRGAAGTGAEDQASDRSDSDRPALYCSRRLDWDPRSRRKTVSRPCPRPPSFANALVENIAFGNTILLNPAAARLVRATAPLAQDVPYHDWWLYLLITGAGGRVIHDAEPGLLYRQHSENLVGAETGLKARLAQESRLPYAARVERNLKAIGRASGVLTPQARTQLAAVLKARAAPLPQRLSILHRAGVYRQSWRDQLQFWGAVALGRV